MPAQTIQLLENAFALLDCFSQEQPELGVREAARMSNLSKSTTGRLLVAMREAGVLSQNPNNRSYRLAGRVLAWSGVYTSTLDLRTKAMPVLEELHRATRETITLYALEGEERVCIERLESPQNLRLTNRIGRRMPLYAGSGGKAILAFLPTEQREKILNQALHPITAKTIIDPRKLSQQIDEICEKGYAYSDGEWVPEAAGVGAPIFDHNGQVIGSVVISGPSQRFTAEIIAQNAPAVVQGALKISSEMGFLPGTTFG